MILKIAIVVNSFPETSETFIINKVIALANAGHSIEVVRLNRSGNTALKMLYKFNENKNIQIVDPNIPTSISRLFSAAVLKPALFWTTFTFSKKRFSFRLRRKIFMKLFNEGRFDIVHFEFSGLAINFLDILKYIKPRTVVSCRGSAEKVKILSPDDLFGIMQRILMSESKTDRNREHLWTVSLDNAYRIMPTVF